VSRVRVGIATFLLAATAAPAVAGPEVSDGIPVDDYFKIKRVLQLALSPDGKTAAYIVSAGSVAAYLGDKLSAGEKRKVRTAYLQPVADGSTAIALEDLSDAQGLTWMPDSRQLAFTSARDGVAQVFAYDTRTGATRQLTESSDGVLSFQLTPDGKSLAYITRAAPPPSQSLFTRLMDGEEGVVVDSNRLSVYDFLDPHNDSNRHPPPAVLHVALSGAATFDVAVPGEPSSDARSYHWSPDGRLLSITYLAADLRPSLVGSYRTSVGVFDTRTRQFRVLAKALEQEGTRSGTRYSGGEWLPNGRQLLIRRVIETDAWVSPNYPDWAVVDVAAGLPTQPSAWKPVSIYGSGTAFVPAGGPRVLLEKTEAGARSLFELTGSTSAQSPSESTIVAGVEGSTFLFDFDRRFTTAVFVHESLTQAPEVYFWRAGRQARSITRLNEDITKRVPFTSREVSWKSTDGTTARGWLLEPAASTGKRPWPMVTHVHGGPGFAYTNSFAPYFEVWPFPFEALASRGVAVFVPNYRGTQTYGRGFASPKRTDREPVDDIATGVKALVASGFADPQRLGISGHSHGGWLGPMVMTREHLFRASSFAEGSSNEMVNYELMPGDLNRQVHDPISGLGASMWDDPTLYLEGSPDLHFKGVRTASLWEAGSRSLSVMMMGYPKVASHFGAPTEYVVYPRTGHNASLPHIQREIAERNLDWFTFWLQGTELPSPDKEAQYARWRQKRAASSVWREEFGDGAK